MNIRRTHVQRLVDVVSIMIVASVVAVGIGIAAIRVLHKESTAANGSVGGRTDLARDSLSTAELSEQVTTGHWVGSETASVLVLVFGDYACGYSVQLYHTLQALLRRYPQHVAIIFKHFVPPSVLTEYRIPEGAECAAVQGRFEEYMRVAYTHGEAVRYSNGWRMFADSARIPDMPEFVKCVRSRRFVTSLSNQYEDGTRNGVALTPTLFVNGERIVGSIPFVQLDSVVAMKLRGRNIER